MSRFDGLSSRRRLMPALVVAASIVLFGMVKIVVNAIVFSASSVAQSGIGEGVHVFSVLVSPLQLWILLPLGLGVFVSLSWLAPVSAGLRLSFVIMRSLLACVSGVILVFIGQLIWGLQGWFVNTQFFGNSSNQAVESFFAEGSSVFPMAVQTATGAGLDALSTVVLAVVLTWSWLVRHSSRLSTEAAVAEV